MSLFLSVSSILGQVDTLGILYWIETDRGAYEYSDTIQWSAHLINNSSDTIKFHGVGPFFYDWLLMDSSGAIWDTHPIPDTTNVYYEVPPGDTLKEQWGTFLSPFFNPLPRGLYWGLLKPYYNHDILPFDTTSFLIEDSLIQIEVFVSTDRSQYQVGESIQIYVTAHNPNQDTVDLYWPDACQFNYWIDSFRGQIDCAQIPTGIILPPDSLHSLEWTHSRRDYLLDVGIHSVVGEVVNYGFSDTVFITVSPLGWTLFPLAASNSWTFVSQSDTLTETVTGTEEVDGILYFSFSRFRAATDFLCRLDGNKLFMHTDTSESLLYDFSANPGDSWTAPTPSFFEEGQMSLVSKIDTVQTPAGTFVDCYHFHHFIGDDYEFHEWFAPGIGMVQRDVITIAGLRRWGLAETTVFSVGGSLDRIPESFYLSQNFPNPFNPQTIIEFSIPQSGMVTLFIYDVLGREVETILNEYRNAGHHKLHWNASDVPSGIYFMRMQSGSFSQVRKVTVVR